jgi:hypothetical protein
VPTVQRVRDYRPGVPRIGHTDSAVVVRTDFSSQQSWPAVREQMLAESDEGFRAYVEIVDDGTFEGAEPDRVLASIGDDYGFSFVIIADRRTMTDAEHPLLVIDLVHEPGRSFRAVPGAIQSVENNLSIANMDFFEFADAATQEGGVYRGFR